MKYIDSVTDQEHEQPCIFCDKPACGDDQKELILHRGRLCFVLMNLYPYNTGHLMVAPYRHAASLEDLEPEEAVELMELTTECVKVIKRTMGPEGMNLGINLGKAAGAGFDAHVHMHVVPRWAGDTNFMPVIGETKVMPESLEQTYVRLKESLEDS